ncbi:MAG: DeoR family transcriptional regulator [Anaerolineae bacterium]|jgi:DeoR family transcriptional regulator, copper-sensing transcriptional repressor|nr:DeoR family transcriptional regulator [Anaerolineae bacterium]MBT7191060.1 DeoR family transcriptional regulator [Anaerolineae bacterium]
MPTPHQRQQEILDFLEKRGNCSIQELSELLSVSAMTIHRDLDKLTGDGAVIKVHGGAMLRPVARAANFKSMCSMCRQSVRGQLVFSLQFNDEKEKEACCPHCGLMMLNMQNPILMLATDFLSGNKINALQAAYLVQPDLKTCCSPSVLSFSAREDAQRFQQGFGGALMSFSETRGFLSDSHALPDTI